MTNSTSFQYPPRPWQDTKRLSNGDRVLILTDTKSYTSALYGRSTPQKWHRVGAFDLRSEKIGYFDFSTDDVRAMMRAGISPAPWARTLSVGMELTRLSHGHQPSGRFRENVKLIELKPELLGQGPALRRYFEGQLGFSGNSKPGMWDMIVASASRVNDIEAAALSMSDWFAASAIKDVVGHDVNVSHVLSRMVREGRLKPNGKSKRGARYRVPPPVITARADWTE